MPYFKSLYNGFIRPIGKNGPILYPCLVSDEILDTIINSGVPVIHCNKAGDNISLEYTPIAKNVNKDNQEDNNNNASPDDKGEDNTSESDSSDDKEDETGDVTQEDDSIADESSNEYIVPLNEDGSINEQDPSWLQLSKNARKRYRAQHASK